MSYPARAEGLGKYDLCQEVGNPWFLIKHDLFQVLAVSVLLYEGTCWTMTKLLEKNPKGNYTRMLRAILNKSWKQHPTKRNLYRHLPPISQTIQVRQTTQAGHCGEVRTNSFATFSYGLLYMDIPVLAAQQGHIHQLCSSTGYSL